MIRAVCGVTVAQVLFCSLWYMVVLVTSMNSDNYGDNVILRETFDYLITSSFSYIFVCNVILHAIRFDITVFFNVGSKFRMIILKRHCP